VNIIKRFVDYSFSQPPPQVIQSAGYDGVAIYTDAALPDAAYISQVRALGLEVLFIKEGGPTELYGGFNVGVRFAVSANDRLDSVGAPQDCAIAYVFADTPFTGDNEMAALQQAAAGIRSIGRRGLKVGYGNEAALRFANPDFWWGVETWSDARNGLAGWEGKTPPVAMIQMANSRALDVPGYDTDENIVLIESFGQWGAHTGPQAQTPTPTTQHTEGTTMLKFTDVHGTVCEFYRSGDKLVVRYWKDGAPLKPVILSEPPWSGANAIHLDPAGDLLPVEGFGLVLVHAATQDGHLIEAYPGPYGYQTRVI
jgi:hypothetical protein